MTEAPSPALLTTFGEYLRYLRRRARLTQRELGTAVGYSEAHIARLENNQRMPDPAVVSAQFVEALGLKDDPEAAQQLIRLAEAARGMRYSHRAGASSIKNAPPTNLRTQLTSFVGRAEEIAEIKQLLSGTRLLTLTGPGGVGKTRLAVQVASEVLPLYPDGVWIVPLASVQDGAQVPSAVAAAIGMAVPDPVTVESLRDRLLDGRAMIVLDTCEHLIAACATLAIRLVQMCPNLTVLATSREPLNVPGEVIWQVPPMRCDEAMQLFVERAKAVRPDFTLAPDDQALLVQVCQQLDGLPLAIELAAARLRVLSLAQIAARLDDRFGLLTGGNRLAPPKQQTLRTMIDWSYDLLSEAERAMLRRLSIFPADWTLELAEAVCAWQPENEAEASVVLRREDVLDLLTNLVNKSLVIVDERGAQPHYSLSNTIRQYAHEKLVEAGEFDTVYQRYLAYLPFASPQHASPQQTQPRATTTKSERKKQPSRSSVSRVA
ncbi:MAG: helix-turn-helix domain-containing protein [Thermoflexales bacterium]|nr:helix-turn-helix domain-containing protein [Thermoflexales bacterium]MDW8350644.1 helix-turn-helix domain-containing protein [Anaerolineae bacterium]